MELMVKWSMLLHNAGHEVTSKWIRGLEETMSLPEAAQMDLDDIDRADVVISCTLPKGTVFSSGGRHVEFGYALAKDKLIINVGPNEENIFHHLPQVTIVPTIEEAIRSLRPLMFNVASESARVTPTAQVN